MICSIGLFSLAIDCILTCYISNERSYFSLSNHILDIIMFFRKYEFKTIFITYFFNIDILVTVHVFDLKFCFHILKVPLEGSVSQILYLGLGSYFMSKNG